MRSGNALGVVEPVDADDHGAAGQAVEHLAHEGRFDRAPRQPRESLGLDADREDADPHRRGRR